MRNLDKYPITIIELKEFCERELIHDFVELEKLHESNRPIGDLRPLYFREIIEHLSRLEGLMK